MITIKHISQLLSCFLIFFSLTLKAQNSYLTNPSLDGNNEDKTLEGWETCAGTDASNNVLENNNPDFLDYYTDTVYNDTLYHKDGANMCLLRTRGINNEKTGRRSTYEHISSQLITPFEKDSSYTLALWLINLHIVHVADLVDPDISFPLRFQVFGADGYCTANDGDKLADTLVKNEEWEKYVLYLQPKKDYNYIYFRVYWDDSIKITQNGTYSGFIFVDGAELIKTCETQYLPTDTLYYKQDPPLQLTAPLDLDCYWSPEKYLSDATSQSPEMIKYNDSLQLVMMDDDYCKTIKDYKILLSCDTLYPTKICNTFDVYYKTYEDNILAASGGNSYYWHDSSSLSSNTTNSVIINNYQEQFKVTVTDENGCDYEEIFNVILDCEYLYNIPYDSSYNYRSTDSTVTIPYGESITLRPILYDSLNIDVSTIASFTWSPADYLSCTDCFETVANLLEDQTYQVEYRDTFNCLFYDYITIELEFGKIPNVITPGKSDGKNDIFKIPGLPDNSAIEIYDKSGRLIFKSNHYSSPNWWDGTDMDGKQVRSGTYWYVLTTPISTKPIKGFVMVIR